MTPSDNITLCSLGLSCQTAHQLALNAPVLGATDKICFAKGPFDWLICPPLSLARWLDAGLPDFERDELIIERNHVYWRRFDFWFWHGFYTGEKGDRVTDIDATFDREMSKLAHQRAAFNGTNPAQTIFVWSNTQNNLESTVFTDDEKERYHVTPEVQEQVQNSLDTYFRMETNVLWLTSPDRSTAAARQRSNTLILSPDESEWKGNDTAWHAVLEIHLG